MVFQVDYDEIEVQKIVMTSSQWRHHCYDSEKRHKNYVTIFSNLGLLQSKFLATPMLIELETDVPV